MTRYLQIALALLAFGIGGAVLWDNLRADDSPPETVRLASQDGPATIAWGDGGVVHLSAGSRADAARALGYAHGQKRSWPASLWRQTALGRLSGWFGPGVLSIDRHARRLGFARHAREAYRDLPAPARAMLQAYTDGLNAALEANRTSRAAPFVSLGIEPAPWEPWHPLALERLFAWLTRPALSPPASAPPDLTSFAADDGLMRRWLHLHGFRRSIAWAVTPDSLARADSSLRSDSLAFSGSTAASGTPAAGGPAFFHRLVTGSSALPFIQEVSLRRSGEAPVLLATIPGTLLFPGGRSVSGRSSSGGGSPSPRSWGLLLGSPGSLQRTAIDSSQMRTWRDRLEPSSSRERLVTVRRAGGGLPLGPARVDSAARKSPMPGGALSAERPDTLDATRTGQASPDSSWVLQWSGFSRATDLAPMLHLAGLDTARTARAAPGFSLFQGNGLAVGPGTSVRVMGRPPVVTRFPGGVVVGRSEWARSQAEALQGRAGPDADVATWSISDSSTWAAAVLPAYLDSLAAVDSSATRMQSALTYLRNWDLRYDRASIAASIFDRWMLAYQRLIGRRPEARDTTFFAPVRRRRALRRAVRSLTTRFGTDMRRWRWERIAPDRRAFPVWAADTLVQQSIRPLATTRYAPLQRPGSGHPSTLAGGRSLLDTLRPPATAFWDGWSTAGDSTLTVRRLRFVPAAFLGRSLLAGDPPDPVVIPPSASSSAPTTELLPDR